MFNLKYSIAAIAIVGVVTGPVTIIHNRSQFSQDTTQLQAQWHSDVVKGVSPQRFSSLSQTLHQLSHRTVGGVPARWLGTETVALAQLKTQTAEIYRGQQQRADQQAQKALTGLIQADPTLTASTVHQDKHALSTTHTPMALNHLTRQWQNTRRHYQETVNTSHAATAHALASLETTEGSNLPASTRTSLAAQLNQAKTPAQLTALAQQINDRLEQYQNAMAKLSHLGDGLQNGQPRTILTAQRTLQNLLNQADAQHDSIPNESALHSATAQYLNAPLLQKIQGYPSLINQLNQAIATIHQIVTAPPPSALPTTITPGPPLGSTFKNYIQTRAGTISVALYNATDNTWSTYNPGIEFDTASIVKVSIMGTLLWQAQNSKQPLSAAELALMTPMIELSSNSAATTLWQDAPPVLGLLCRQWG